MKIALEQALLSSKTYVDYRQTVNELLEKGLSSGDVQSDELYDYSKLNIQRMDRLDKTMVVSEENIEKLLQLQSEYIWLVIAEGWCGDAAQIVPIIHKMANISPKIKLKIIFRDQHLAVMDAFLTNGARSIPKLVVLDKSTHEVKGTWGPRPKSASDLIISYKQQYGVIDDTAKKELHLWYTRDKGLSTQQEILQLMADVENALYAKR